jgi:prophage antirepressor-like protein
MSNLNTALQAFAFDSHAVRVVMIDEYPWFVAKDVCNCLEITNHRNALTRLDDDEKGVQTLDTLGGAQQISVINESGLYSLILRSQGATTPGTPAHTFRKWVTAEVLPSIRKTGSYAAPNSQVAQMDRLLRLAEEMLMQSKAIVEIATTALKPKPPRKPNRPITPEETEQALEWKAQGMSQNEIARQLNRSTGTVSYMIRGLRHD